MKDKTESIIFICIGNTCRSVMAEYIAKQVLAPHINVASAGVQADGKMYQQLAVDLINQEYQLLLKAMPSKNICDVELLSYDKIYVLDSAMWKKLKKDETVKDRLYCYHFDDPWEGDLGTYTAVFKQIQEMIKILAEQDLTVQKSKAS